MCSYLGPEKHLPSVDGDVATQLQRKADGLRDRRMRSYQLYHHEGAGQQSHG